MISLGYKRLLPGVVAALRSKRRFTQAPVTQLAGMDVFPSVVEGVAQSLRYHGLDADVVSGAWPAQVGPSLALTGSGAAPTKADSIFGQVGDGVVTTSARHFAAGAVDAEQFGTDDFMIAVVVRWNTSGYGRIISCRSAATRGWSLYMDGTRGGWFLGGASALISTLSAYNSLVDGTDYLFMVFGDVSEGSVYGSMPYIMGERHGTGIDISGAGNLDSTEPLHLGNFFAGSVPMGAGSPLMFAQAFHSANWWPGGAANYTMWDSIAEDYVARFYGESVVSPSICFLGDSITQSTYYRTKVSIEACAAGYRPDFVGSKTDAGSVNIYDHNGHDGYSGLTAAQLASGWPTYAAAHTSRPGFICCQVGTNDVPSTTDADFISAYGSLLAAIDASYSGVKILVGDLTPYIGQATRRGELNALLPGIVATAAAAGIDAECVATGTELLDADISGDNVHPVITSGYYKLGDAWWAAIAAQL